MKEHNFLAFDIGATSGRAVLGTTDGVKFGMRELHRFPNGIIEIHNKYYWNIFSLYEQIKQSLLICGKENIRVDSIGIDTWGVDFGYIGEDGVLIGLPRAYRDPYTKGAPDEFFNIVSKDELYRRTGIQIMEFNSLFQLFRSEKESFSPMNSASEALFIPDLLNYLLTGNRLCEYTIASTSQVLDPVTHQFDRSLLAAAGVKNNLFRDPVMPGTLCGYLTDELARESGLGKVAVVAVAGHDTASAVAAVPAVDKHFAYLSSGTWSLMGIETGSPILTPEAYKYNFTNEGGIEGTTRFLKNITGMWLLEQCKKEWIAAGHTYTYDDLTAMAATEAGFTSSVFPDDPVFTNPVSMTESIINHCKEKGQSHPGSHAEFVRCIFNGLALRYREVLDLLKTMAPFSIEKLYVIGGGAKNALLNQLTADVCRIPVIAGPSEATAIGNCLVQAQAAGLFKDRWEMRRLLAENIPLTTYLPD